MVLIFISLMSEVVNHFFSQVYWLLNNVCEVLKSFGQFSFVVFVLQKTVIYLK